MVRLLLEYGGDPNAVCNGQTPLTLAIALANEPVVDLLLNHPRTDPATTLGAGNGNALCLVLSTAFEVRWPYPKRLKLVRRAMIPRLLFISRLDRTFDREKSESVVSDSLRTEESAGLVRRLRLLHAFRRKSLRSV